MPEIKHNFTGGKMNKDVDQRLVPKGEYRDAMNIQVSTSEGSDVGTVQNILGNIEGCNNYHIPSSSFTVGSVSDEKNDTLYWLVSGDYNGASNIDLGGFSSVSDMIIRKTPTKCEPVFIDQFAFSIANNTDLNFGSVSELNGLPAEVYGEIEPGWTITGLTADGNTSNTVEVVSVMESAQYTANLGVPLINLAGNIIVPLDAATGTMSASNNVLYLDNYNPNIILSDFTGQNVNLFDSSHPDNQTNIIASAQIVNFTIVSVQPFPQAPIYSNVQYVELTLQNNITPFTNSSGFVPQYTTGTTVISGSYNNSIIWGSLTLPTAPSPTTIPIPNNTINHTISTAITVGDLVLITGSGVSGCVGAINTNTSFTLVDCSTGVPVSIPNNSFLFTFPSQTTVILNANLNLNSASPLHESLIIEKPRVLNFNHDEYITGINIIDDMLFWTDGKTEPKKINISRSIEGTQGFTYVGGVFVYNHTRLIVEGVDKGPIKEEHITVIRKAPLQSPYLQIKSTAGEGITSGDQVVGVGSNAVTPFASINVGSQVSLDFTEIPGNPFGFKQGDIMLLSDNVEDLPSKWQIRASIESITSSGGVSTFLIKIEGIAPLISTLAASWFGHLEQEKSLFQRKLPRFAYRYKYEDGEYSSFGPFTEVAFAPSNFDYEGTEAYNKGVVNSIKSLKIQNFVTADIPLDVVSIDLLYKNEINPSVHLLKTVTPNDAVLEGQDQNYWNTPGSSLLAGANKGSYEVSSENISSTISSSQSLRVYDNVPQTALAQEITGNRIVYGNYVQGYDTIQPDLKAWLGSRRFDETANVGEKSIKTLRDYDIGVVWGDKYGRETPVKTSGSLGSIKVPKSKSVNSNYINVSLKNSPDWAEYYRVYVKETSNEYYNLPVDRVYDAADGNVWISFPSVDRNKVDEDTYIILKKGPDSEEFIREEARYKIVAIENEAPEYIKTTFELLARTNTDGSKGDNSCELYNGDSTTNAGECTFPSGANAPVPGRKGFSINSNLWSENSHETTNLSALGMQLTSPKVLFDEVIQNDSGSTTDELYVSFSKEEEDADGNIAANYTERYHVVSVEDKEVTQDSGGDYYYINLDTAIKSRDSFITEVVALTDDNIHVHFWKKTIINKPEFDGRFFVKIKSDTTIQNNLIKTPSATRDLMVIEDFALYKIADTDLSNFVPSIGSGKYLFHNQVEAESAPAAVSTDTKAEWDNLLKFGGSTRRSGWFIDNATFASQQNGAQILPSSGQLSYNNVTTLITDGNTRKTCNTTTYIPGQKVTGTWYPTPLTPSTAQYTLDTLAGYPFNLTVYSQNVGDGMSNGQVAMRGVHAQGSDKYIDLAYSQFGPDGPSSDGKTQNYDLDWRIGDPANTSTDQEDGIVSNLKPETLFRVNGSSVIYKIISVQKFRLFNYHGAKRSSLVKVSANTIPFHGTLWNTTHTSQVKSIQRRQNRRITYRIKYEVSEIFSPDAFTANAALDTTGEPIADITANTNSYKTIQFLTDFLSDGENPISTNPAIFETEPKDDIDIDIYYEASSSLPILPITNKNKYLFIPIGSTIIPPVDTDFPEGVFIASWENINLFSPVNIINLSVTLDAGAGGDYEKLLNTPINYIEKDNGEIVSFAVTGNVLDPTTGMVKSLIINPKNEVGLNWFNCWSFNNGVESNRIGDTYNKPYITNGVTASSSTEELQEREHRKHGLIYSGIYNSTSGVNNLNQFIAAEKITKDINPIYSSIQKLHSGWGQGGDLVTLCEDRILKILANKDALFNSDGNANLTSTNNVLGQAIPYSGEYGISKNPESLASEAYRIYFTDKVRGTVMRLSMDGLTPISNHGMKDWFRDNLKLGDKLVGSYDDRKNEYNITIRGNTTAKTVTFKEDVKGWVSFKSFTPENAISCANEYYTFKDGAVWKHHDETVNRNTFYNQDLVPSTLEVVFNEVPGSVKSFKTVNYEGSQAKVTKETSDNEYFNLEDVDGWHVTNVITNLEQGGITEFVEKEGKWFGYVIGNDITISSIGNVSSDNYDTEDSSIQGIGRTASVVNSIVYGCMDDTMFNYNSAATIDDGGCVGVVNGCIDLDADNFQASANTDDGSCIYYGCTTGPLAVWSQELSGGSMNYDANANTDDGSCIPAVWGCTDSTMFNYDVSANFGSGFLSDGTFCGYANCMCIPYIYGCTDPNASNYFSSVDLDDAVNADDGSCLYSGCTDPLAENYSFTGSAVDSNTNSFAYLNGAAVDDGSCTYIGGCTDSLACNYDATATQDNGSCYFCGDNHADNYDAVIPFTDYTCLGACTYCNDVASVSIIGQTTADTGMNNGEVTIEWPASTSNSVTSYQITGSTIAGATITPSGNATETYTITGLGTGTYTFYVMTFCTSNNGVELLAGAMLPGGNMGTGPNFGISVSTTITASPIPGCTDGTGANNNVGGTWGACNYNASATVDDGSCEYTTCTGCNDNTYLEYCGDCWDPINQVVVASGGSPWVADTIPTSCLTLIVNGCMDATAFNYDPNATVDDGSCVPFVYGCMDDTLNNNGTYAASNYTALANTDDGSCNSYECPTISIENVTAQSGVGGAAFAFRVKSNLTPYSFGPAEVTSEWSVGTLGFTGDVNVTGSTGSWVGTTNSVGANNWQVYHGGSFNTIGSKKLIQPDSKFFSPGDTTVTIEFNLYTNDGNCTLSTSNTYSIGCTDNSATNTGSFDITDDTQCTYSGCTDNTASNFDPLAGADDGSCVYAGCTDSDANNYDSAATPDDGSCIYSGCMDATLNADGSGDYAADNYNPDATTPCNDGTGNNSCCTYSGAPLISGAEGFPTGSVPNAYQLIRAEATNAGTAYNYAEVTSINVGVGTTTNTINNPGMEIITSGNWSNGTQNFTDFVQQADWAPYVDINGAYGAGSGDLTITYNTYFYGDVTNPSIGDALETTVSNSFVLSAGCKTDASAMNYNSNLDLHIDGSCIAPNPGCMDSTATNYNAAFNQDCTFDGSTNPNDCCCYTCDEPTFTSTSLIAINATGTNSDGDTYGTQVTFNFANVSTAVNYDIYMKRGGTMTFFTTNASNLSVNNGIASYVYNNTYFTNFFVDGTTMEFVVIANCENADGDSCGTNFVGWMAVEIDTNTLLPLP